MTNTVHTLSGLRADRLDTYLAALGLIKVLAEVDSGLTAWWEGESLRIETTDPSLRDVHDLRDVLVENYQPLPAYSPWNGGSGFGEKDRNQRAAIEKLLECATPRLDRFRETYEVVVDIVEHVKAVEGSKEELVARLHDRIPEYALAWLDAVLVQGTDKLLFPILYGTGGNDGRLDFSTNFHQHLARVIPEVGGPIQRSRRWVEDLLLGMSTQPQVAAAAGMYNPSGGATPGTAELTGKSLVNPWTFVLIVESTAFLTAAPVRALGQRQAQASPPFTVVSNANSSPDNADAEERRGEFWAPIWSSHMTHAEIRRLFLEARASWDQETAGSSTAMASAAKSGGVDMRCTAFRPFELAQRNGLAYTAAHRELVKVTNRDNIAVAIPISHRARAFRHGSSGRAATQIKRMERAHADFAKSPDDRLAAPHLAEWLAALCDREYSAAISDVERKAITGASTSPHATDVVPALGSWLSKRPEHRLGAALASVHVNNPDQERFGRRSLLPIRTLLLGEPPRGEWGWIQPVIRGFASRSLSDVLADVVVWVDHHSDEATRGAGRGLRLVHHRGYSWCEPGDVTGWVQGRLDERALQHAFAAALVLDWRGHMERHQRRSAPSVPDPRLALLQAVASCEIILPGYTWDSLVHQGRQGWPRGWAVRLRAGRVNEVASDASVLLNRSRLAPMGARLFMTQEQREHFFAQQENERRLVERRASTSVASRTGSEYRLGSRFAAALLAPVSLDGLRQLGLVNLLGQPTKPSVTDENQLVIAGTQDQ